MKRYKEFLITAEPFIPEILSSVLWQLKIDGISEEVNCLKLFTEENTNVTVDAISNVLNKLINEKLLFNFNIEENLFEDKNWNEEWEKSLKVIEITDRIVIKPTFRNYNEKEGQIVIQIDPKMSFGTGEHQTTKLVLMLLEKYIKGGESVLDVGSGTGVLAIAAVKLGAASAVAADNDEWCFNNGRENCELNNVSSLIDVRLCEINDVKENDFNLIVANIQKNVLIEIAEQLNAKMKKGGILILSGLLFSDEEDIKTKYTSLGMEAIDSMKMDDWITLVFRKN